MPHAQFAQQFSLRRRTGRREDFCTLALHQLYRREPNATGGRMNQYTFTSAQPRKTLQTIMGGEKCNRQTSRVLRFHVLGQRREEGRRHDRLGCQARGREPDNTIPDSKLSDGRTNLSNNPRTFRPERNVSTRVHAKRHQHVAEIDPCGQHAEF